MTRKPIPAGTESARPFIPAGDFDRSKRFYEALGFEKPSMQPWGLRIAYLYDPSGVLWHVSQRRKGAPQD